MAVDDNPTNLKLLESILGREQYNVTSFPLGRLALKAAMNRVPDLILLDINMPEMDGFQVCEQLKSSDKLARVPVIFLSSMNDPTDRVRALRTGGVDYIAKPFQLEEVLARVETHLNLRKLQQDLERIVAQRTRQLEEANVRLSLLDHAKSDFLNLISHEIRTPLSGLIGIAELVLGELPASEENAQFARMFEQIRSRMVSIMDHALLLNEIDVNRKDFKSLAVSLNLAIDQALGKAADLARARKILLPTPPPDMGTVCAEPELLVSALHALLETAIRLSKEGQTFRILHRAHSKRVCLRIDSVGFALPENVARECTDLMALRGVGAWGEEIGLGPAVAQRILSLFGGSLTVENRSHPVGVQWTVTFNKWEP